VYWSSQKITRFSCLTLMKLEFSQQIFQKKNHEKIQVGGTLFKGTGIMQVIVPFKSFKNANY